MRDGNDLLAVVFQRHSEFVSNVERQGSGRPAPLASTLQVWQGSRWAARLVGEEPSRSKRH